MSKELAFQIRGLRDNADLSQPELAEKLGTSQNAISRLENPNYGKATVTTLKKLAAVFDVGLMVRFVPFSQLVNWESGTPYIEYGLSPQSMNVLSFEQENKSCPSEKIERIIQTLKAEEEAVPKKPPESAANEALGNATYLVVAGCQSSSSLGTLSEPRPWDVTQNASKTAAAAAAGG